MGKITLKEHMTWLIKLHVDNNQQMYCAAYDDSDESLYVRAHKLHDLIADNINCPLWRPIRDDILTHVLEAIDWEEVVTDVFGDE